MKHLLILAFALLMSASSFANNLAISNITVAQAAGVGGTVGFTISWDNSWRTSSAPNNWDAIWLIVKFRDCLAPASTAYTHGSLNGTLSTHTIPATLESMTSASGVSSAAGIDASPTGIMIRRSSVGAGSIAVVSVTLNVTNLPANTTVLSTRVFGVEMVYIPSGSFYVGDGDGVSVGSTYRFSTASNANAALPALITSEGAVAMYHNGGAASSVSIPAAWPKGFNGFYIMKTEISQGQYAEFLNTLSTAQQTTRYLGNVGTNRNQTTVTFTNIYASSRPERAQNYLAWDDYSAYLDWACLRPLTEFEYEKACRGNDGVSPVNYVTGEFPWGSTYILASTSFQSPGIENGTETMVGNANYINSTYPNGDGGTGPGRCGIFATASSDRVAAGAGYYGVLDLAGNVREFYLVMHTTAATNAFTRSYGDGALDANGDQAVATWRIPAYVYTISSFGYIIGLRGGSWASAVGAYPTVILQTSDRSGLFNASATYVTSRYSQNGGRGGR